MATAIKRKRAATARLKSRFAVPPKHKAANGETLDGTAVGLANGSKHKSGGDSHSDTELSSAASTSNGHSASRGVKPVDLLQNGHEQSGRLGVGTSETERANADLCRSLQGIYRRRLAAQKMRIKIDNGLAAVVMQGMGYGVGKAVKEIPEAERSAYRERADALIATVAWNEQHSAKIVEGRKVAKPIAAEDSAVARDYGGIIKATLVGRVGFGEMERTLKDAMGELVLQLPDHILSFVHATKGFDIDSLAKVIGEAGNLADYSNPGKLWKRFGLAPYQGQLPSTWRKFGGLKADDWKAVGYNPRRRSVAYIFGECMMKQNDGEYRERYEEARRVAAEKHPDWKPIRSHRHGMAMATKRLLRNLWCVWNPTLVRACESVQSTVHLPATGPAKGF